MWLKDRKVFEWTPEEFWTEIFSYMRLTNDQKYPEKQMTKEEQERIVGKIKEFVQTNQDRSKDSFDKFFDEEGADLACSVFRRKHSCHANEPSNIFSVVYHNIQY